MSDILVVDDETDIRKLISDILTDEGFATRLAGTAGEALEALETAQPALVILDIWLKDSHMDGIDILKHIKSTMPDVPVVIISGHGNIEIAVAAIKQGAYDFIEKPFNLEHLLLVIGRAMEASTLRGENTRLKVTPNGEIVGTSSKLKACMADAMQAAQTGRPVLIAGPNGAGKTTIARFIHANRSQNDAGFQIVNCAGVSPAALSENLFGAGGALDVLSIENSKTIFLKNIEFAPLDIQQKIAIYITEQGSDNSPLLLFSSCPYDATKTSENLSFSAELFDQLSNQTLTVPSLAERKSDIPKLLKHFLSHLVQSYGYAQVEFSTGAINLLKTMPWDENINQFRNFIEQILILSNSKRQIGADDIFQLNQHMAHTSDAQALLTNAQKLPMREARDLFEREYLSAQIKRFNGNISRTANFVGMERSALHRKLRNLNISLTGGDKD